MGLFFKKKKNCKKEQTTNSALFYFALKNNAAQKHFEITIDTNCLVLSQYPGAEIKGLGGLIAQNPKNFEILCLTNGINIKESTSSISKRQQFQDIMRNLRVKGSKIFNIDRNCLEDKYLTIKKIDISEIDYIFIPNIYDTNQDTISLLKHFKQLLKDKEHKENLRIIMFESDSPLCSPDCYIDISNIIETKKRMLDTYYPKQEFGYLADKVIALNAYRSLNCSFDYCEAFMTFTIEDFNNISLI